MLLNNFFTIDNVTTAENQIQASITIDAAHQIFEGHFPNQPVVPGVCMLQMVKEIIENTHDIKTNLSLAQDIKFLTVLDPTQNISIECTIIYNVESESNLSFNASLFYNDVVYFKCKASLSIT